MRLHAVNHGGVLVIGDISDVQTICQQPSATDMCYTLSVATPAGEWLVGDIRGRIRCGRMGWQQMVEWLKTQHTHWVTDVSHPYAEVASQSIVRARASIGTLLSRYQRPEQLSDLRRPLSHVVGDLNEVCALAHCLGKRILLTTGSKNLAAWRAGLAGKTLLTRTLPASEVIQRCNDLGSSVGEIFTLCRPFGIEFNTAFYRQCRVSAAVTKVSGVGGGYQEEVQPCPDAEIPCITVTCSVSLMGGDELLESQANFAMRLTRWLSVTWGIRYEKNTPSGGPRHQLS